MDHGRILRRPVIPAVDAIASRSLQPARDPRALVTDAELAARLGGPGAVLGAVAGVVLTVSPVDNLSLAACERNFALASFGRRGSLYIMVIVTYL